MPLLAKVDLSHGNITVDPDYQSMNTTNFRIAILIAPIMVLASLANIWDVLMQLQPSYWKILQTPSIIGLVWRTTVAFYCWTTIGIMLWWYGPMGYAYFTVWNWSAITIYMTLGALRFFHPSDLQLAAAHQCIGEFELSSSWLVAIVVWSYLGPHSQWNPMFMDYVGISMHACNAFIMTVDVFFVQDLHIDYTQSAVVSLWASLYLMFHLIANAACGFMAYPFLRTDDPFFLVYVFGILAILILMYIFSGFLFEFVKTYIRRRA